MTQIVMNVKPGQVLDGRENLLKSLLMLMLLYIGTITFNKRVYCVSGLENESQSNDDSVLKLKESMYIIVAKHCLSSNRKLMKV